MVLTYCGLSIDKDGGEAIKGFHNQNNKSSYMDLAELIAHCVESCTTGHRVLNGTRSLEQTQHRPFLRGLQTFDSFVWTRAFVSEMIFEAHEQSLKAIIMKHTHHDAHIRAVSNTFCRDWFHHKADNLRLASSKDCKPQPWHKNVLEGSCLENFRIQFVLIAQTI